MICYRTYKEDVLQFEDLWVYRISKLIPHSPIYGNWCWREAPSVALAFGCFKILCKNRTLLLCLLQGKIIIFNLAYFVKTLRCSAVNDFNNGGSLTTFNYNLLSIFFALFMSIFPLPFFIINKSLQPSSTDSFGHKIFRALGQIN